MTAASGSRDVKEEQIQAVLQQMRAAGITLDELSAALKTGDAASASQSGDLVMKLMSYFGGIFVFSGLCIFVGTIWDDLNSAARIIVTLGPGIVAYVMGLMALREERFVRITTPLLLIAAAMQPSGMLVAIDELFTTGSDARYAFLAVFSVMAVQQAVTFASYRRTLLAFTSLFFGYSALFIILDLLDATPTLTAIMIGASMTAFGKSLHDSPHRFLAGPAYFFGSILFMAGCFDWFYDTPFEILYVGVVGGLIYASVWFRSRALLFNGVVAMLSYIGYFSGKHFADSLGWPLVLIILGLVFFGLSSAAWKLKKRYF